MACFMVFFVYVFGMVNLTPYLSSPGSLVSLCEEVHPNPYVFIPQRDLYTSIYLSAEMLQLKSDVMPSFIRCCHASLLLR